MKNLNLPLFKRAGNGIRLTVASLLALTCVGAVAPAITSQERSRTEAQADERFQAVDVYVNAGNALLAAWQVELHDPSGRTKIVGVEGGEHAAFRAAPYYDPRALTKGRIVLAAYQTKGVLPTGRTRVARLHLLVSGPSEPELQATITAAVSPDGRDLQATVELE